MAVSDSITFRYSTLVVYDTDKGFLPGSGHTEGAFSGSGALQFHHLRRCHILSRGQRTNMRQYETVEARRDGGVGGYGGERGDEK